MTGTIDHRRLVDEILEEVASAVADPFFGEEEQSLSENLEKNRGELTDQLRANPALVQKVRDAKAGRAQPEAFAHVDAHNGHFMVATADFMGLTSEEERRQLGMCLTDRTDLYDYALFCAGLRISFMTNGEERIFPWWMTRPFSPRQAFLPCMWTQPADRNGFPHHQVAYLRLAASLLKSWEDEEFHPGLQVHVGERTHVQPLLPVKALMLDAVDRLPPVFFSLDKLRAQLDRITSVTFDLA